MASNVFVYLSFHEPRRLRLSAEPLPELASIDAMRERCFDYSANERFYQNWLDEIGRPYADLLQGLIERGARFLVNVSGPLLQKLSQDRGSVAASFKGLLADPRITPVCSDIRNSIALYLDVDLFQQEMERGQQLVLEATGRHSELAVAPLMAINTEVYHVLGRLGFRGAIVDGNGDLLRGRETGQVYRAGAGPLLLPRDGDISHGLAAALAAARHNYLAVAVSPLADKVAARADKFVLVGYSIDRATGPAACAALGQWVDETQRHGVGFPDVNQLLGGANKRILNLQLPAVPAISSEYGNMRYFLGHPSQQSVFCLMRQAFWAARLSRDEAVVDLTVDLAQWDVLELLHHVLASNGNGQPINCYAPGVMERIGAYGLPPPAPLQVNEFYQNLVRGVTASYL